MKLVERIKMPEHYIEQFKTWEATEQIIDDKKALWCLKKPNSNVEKICLYRDGCNMFVYGDYGQFTFDSMTWLGDVYNLQYDNIGYQMEKLNYESRKTLSVHDDDQCEKDILEWFTERVGDRYDVEDVLINKAIKFLKDNNYLMHHEIEKFCTENDCDELVGIVEFTFKCLKNTDEYDWIAFLRNEDFIEFDEECESSLWDAGKCIHQRYFVCMYALQVCGEKLNQKKEC